MLIYATARKHILDNFIFYLAKTGILNRHSGKTLSITDTSVRDAANNMIYLSLIHARKLFLRFLG